MTLEWTHTRHIHGSPYANGGHIERHKAGLDGATLTITHMGATVESTRADGTQTWDVSIKVHGQGYGRIFAGQPVHATPALAKEWVLDNIDRIRAAIASKGAHKAKGAQADEGDAE